MKKRLLVAGLSTLMTMSMTFNGFAVLDLKEIEDARNARNQDYCYSIIQDRELVIEITKEAYDKYGVPYDEYGEATVPYTDEARKKAEAEAVAKIAELTEAEFETIPRVEQTVTKVDANTTVYDDGFKVWSGVKNKEGNALQTIRIVTTTRNNGDGSYTINFKVYNTDNVLVDTSKYFITTDISGYFIDRDERTVDVSFILAGNDVSITIPGKTNTVPGVIIREKETGKQIASAYAATGNELYVYNDPVYKLPYAAREAYQKVSDESVANYNKAIEETKEQFPHFNDY